MTKPAYTVNGKGVISIDYSLFREMDPHAVVAACRNNLRQAPSAVTGGRRASRQETVKVLVNVGQR